MSDALVHVHRGFGSVRPYLMAQLICRAFWRRRWMR
jgi:hypothetical protein